MRVTVVRPAVAKRSRDLQTELAHTRRDVRPTSYLRESSRLVSRIRARRAVAGPNGGRTWSAHLELTRINTRVAGNHWIDRRRAARGRFARDRRHEPEQRGGRNEHDWIAR